ncbi:MAG TPA: PhzF family isomerase [Deltaproteobacteria bacterium]|nr:PhzF family isomerase [Deltaproteobacteria bacterium]HPR55608.1 PhzF family isomerase [Deltaproteobacteria bacterium]HXK48300.1 PhzF family isomerase [Deltaproteobacteria bacterium]
MKTYRIYQIDAFTTERFQGNPAGVVANADGLTDAQMQAIARELNNSETAFILSPTAGDHDVWIRFFTPATEVPSCGHATISAHFVRALELGLPSCTVVQRIGIGILPVEVVRQDGTYRIVMTQGAVEFMPPLTGTMRNAVVDALGLSERDLDDRCPVQIVSTGHSKVLVGIGGRGTLNSLRPDLARLAELSELIQCNGYYVFTLSPGPDDVLAHGRMFAPAIGIPEDPVTGNANGPLGAYVVRHGLVRTGDGVFTFRAMQGEAMGRTGIVEVEVGIHNGDPVLVRVGGRAVVAFRTAIEL